MSDRLLLAIAQKHGACNVRVFGSVARGEATPESDIDLLVDYDKRENYALVSRWAIA
ncbi:MULTISPECIES: nucleotidyltransferase domain-containing protein [unclassified Microcoleus]|uniref:nucleotidyltransferase domain-containing protein n=1 Tax=unclassified Microcoleus TaxID=2642155 RepID=UPI002FD3CDC1